MREIHSRQELINEITDMINGAEVARGKFIQKFKDDPFYAMEWSSSMFQAAAFFRVASDFKNALESEMSDKELNDICIRELTRFANPKMSTSIPSNLLHQYEAAAWSEISQLLHWY